MLPPLHRFLSTLPRRTPILPGTITKRSVDLSGLERPPYASNGRAIAACDAPLALYPLKSRIIDQLRTACKLAAEGRDFAASLVKPGRTTEEIDVLVTEFFVKKKRVYPSPINYLGFPKALCTSVNDVMVHGIPDSRQLEDGDVVSLDVSCFVNGVHGDNCVTVTCGNAGESAATLVKEAKSCFEQAVALCGPGVPVKNIGEFVATWCERTGFDTNTDFVGHGIGPLFHMRPLVYHCRNHVDIIMKPGMVFTIEPIITEGSAEAGQIWADGWTVPTKDGSWAAQFEHTILITENGYEVLTKV